MRKHQTNPTGRTFHKVNQGNERQRKMEELSQIGRDPGDPTTKCNA